MSWPILIGFIVAALISAGALYFLSGNTFEYLGNILKSVPFIFHIS